MNDTLLIISPHPDDETLGAGGTILKYKERGSKVAWLNFTDLQTDYGYSATQISTRIEEIKTVASIYGIDNFFNLQFKPAGLDQYPRSLLIKQATEVIDDVKPNTIILPFKSDIHSDHRIVFESVFSITKVFRSPYIKRILMMEVPSETDFATGDDGFIPNYFIDISDFLETKLKIMNIYKSEVRTHPFPRSLENIKALATIRGASAGCKYAESFILIKGIE